MARRRAPKVPRTDRYVSRFATIAREQGLKRGSMGWLYASAAASGVRVLRRFAGRKEEIHPGEGLEIREIPRKQGRA